jgi:hypothetical protein
MNAERAVGPAVGLVRLFDPTQRKILRIAEQLSGAELETGYRLFEQAAGSTTERDSLLRDARLCLNRAISLETGLRLAASWFLLALCHAALATLAMQSQH